MSTSARRLLFRPGLAPEASGVVNRVTPSDAGWDLLGVETRRLARGETWSHETGACEVALVILGGRCSVRSSRGTWDEIGGRDDVFGGIAHALYLPRGTEFELRALSESLELAHAWVPSDQDHEPAYVRPSDCRVELRGGHNATRQINHIIPPGFGCHRIVSCEVYTPGGNWSSYPPHKHDDHRIGDAGEVLEADLEEVYLYRIREAAGPRPDGAPRGYAVQHIYTDDRTLDELVAARDHDIVLVPEGYHPVSAAYGYDCYYLNFLAGSAQSLACTDDPDHAWTKDTWDRQDPRIPMVTAEETAG